MNSTPLWPYRRGSSVSSIVSAETPLLQLLDRPTHVNRVSVTVVGVDDERQVASPRDAVRLIRELRQRQRYDVRRRQHRVRRNRPRQDRDLIARLLRQPCRSAVENRTRDGRPGGIQDGSKAITSLG